MNKIYGSVVKGLNLQDQDSKLKPGKVRLPKYIHYPADHSGCGFWRMIWPASQLLSYRRALVSTLYQLVEDPDFYRGVAAVRIQRQSSDKKYRFVERLREISRRQKETTGFGFKLIWEVDDIICPPEALPDYNVFKEPYKDPKITEQIKRIVHLCDEMTVVSERMRSHYAQHLSYEKISVIPNYVLRNWADGYYDEGNLLSNFAQAKQAKKIRIGYAGSPAHFSMAGKGDQEDDFTHIVKDLIKRVGDYQFVFFGGYPRALHKLVLRGQIEFHPWGSFDRYPEMLHSLKLNIMIAPLMNNVFSSAKSDIKFLEAAALGIPCVAQNLACYEKTPWKFDTADELFTSIEAITASEATYKAASRLARSLIEKRWLDQHLNELQLIYDTPYADASRLKSPDFVSNNLSQFELPPD